MIFSFFLYIFCVTTKTTYQLVLPYTNPVPLSTNQHRQLPTGTALYWLSTSTSFLICHLQADVEAQEAKEKLLDQGAEEMDTEVCKKMSFCCFIYILGTEFKKKTNPLLPDWNIYFQLWNFLRETFVIGDKKLNKQKKELRDKTILL